MKGKVFYGWWMVALGFAVTAYGGATIWYGFTAFFDPLIKEFAWSYAAISLAASIRGAEFGLMEGAIGFLIDRFSIRRIMLGSLILVSAGWLILSRVNSLGIFYTSFFIISAGASGISSVVFLTLLTRWFNKSLGLAIGITMSGFGIGGLAVPGIVYLLDVFGFRTVFFFFGATAIILGVIITYFIRDWPGDVGSSPDGVSPQSGEQISKYTTTPTPQGSFSRSDYTFKDAISTSTFWIITYVNVAAVFVLMTVSTHIMPHLEHLGYSRYAAGFVAMIIPVISICGRLVTGLLSDKMSYRLIMLIALLLQFAGISLFLYSNIFFLLIISVVFQGIAYGSIIVIRAIALRRCYGITSIGAIMGVCMALTMIGNMTGPLVAGWIFDVRGSYNLAWYIAAILLLVSIPLVVMMKQSERRLVRPD
ncbi:MFS transporter [Chloroflexota bacterium]